ncbi:hypothetical protein QBC41DRAFT_130329 [Cercophora samala]|uniref:Transmembrane protein n=1 Tax=Cercophora samala TaxID=330535 RepID=A0AA39ZBR8_9PEZI|nr:hypothetical protein QBC41DRAFT_130329 [Cercophora samala]
MMTFFSFLVHGSILELSWGWAFGGKWDFLQMDFLVADDDSLLYCLRCLLFVFVVVVMGGW